MIKLLHHQPDDANLFDSLRFDLDYDDDPEEEQLRTELYWYYNACGSVAKLRCLHADAHAVRAIDGGVHIQAETVSSERAYHRTG